MKAWLLFRVLRWATWIGAVLYGIEFLKHKSAHMNSFGQLLLSTEMWLFGLPLIGMAFGFFELMMRQQNKIKQPRAFRDWVGARA